MNKVILLGRMVRSAELKTTNNGKSVANFTVAVNRRFKNQAGEYEADFINCQCWAQSAEFITKYGGKGSQVSLSGRLQIRSYDDKEGHKKYITEVICDEVNLVGSKADKKPDDKKSDPASTMDLLDEVFQLMGDDDDVPW